MAIAETIPASVEVMRTRPRTRFLPPATLLLAFVVEGAWFVNTQSMTTDEPGHIAAGIAGWKYGRFTILVDHPPLGRKIITAPLYFSHNVDVNLIRWRAEDPPMG